MSFVERFYQEILNRTYDAGGRGDWSSGLLDGRYAAEGLARGFILSQEFSDRGLSDVDYVRTLYRAFFNRVADAGGEAYWLDQLNGGASRETVMNGFIYAVEFQNLADSYNIQPWFSETQGPNRILVEELVTRFYLQLLARSQMPRDWQIGQMV